MNEKNLNFIIDVLKGKPTHLKPDWNETLGFMIANRVAGLFYSRALKQQLYIPPQIKRFLAYHFKAQLRRISFFRNAIFELSEYLVSEKSEHIFLKGSVFTAQTKDDAIYIDGERISNDIDILVKPSGIESVVKALKRAGYVQGWFQEESGEVKPYSRLEILKRRMTRGETAPFVKLTSNQEIPYIEIDVNFSLGNEPSEYLDLLIEMVDTRILYKGKASIYTPNSELFFMHLILHQYKESRLYFSVIRGKALDIYKLADIYYIWNSKAVDFSQVIGYAKHFHVEKELGSVLLQVGSVFSDKGMLKVGKELGGEEISVYDYVSKKEYKWNAKVRKRLLSENESTFLKEANKL